MQCSLCFLPLPAPFLHTQRVEPVAVYAAAVACGLASLDPRLARRLEAGGLAAKLEHLLGWLTE
jgi:hypothetical protein